MSEPYILIEHGYVLYDPHSDGFIRIDECKVNGSMVFRNSDELGWADRWDDNSFKLLYQVAGASEKSTLDAYVLVPYRKENGNSAMISFLCAILVEDYMDA